MFVDDLTSSHVEDIDPEPVHSESGDAVAATLEREEAILDERSIVDDARPRKGADIEDVRPPEHVGARVELPKTTIAIGSLGLAHTTAQSEPPAETTSGTDAQTVAENVAVQQDTEPTAAPEAGGPGEPVDTEPPNGGSGDNHGGGSNGPEQGGEQPEDDDRSDKSERIPLDELLVKSSHDLTAEKRAAIDERNQRDYELVKAFRDPKSPKSERKKAGEKLLERYQEGLEHFARTAKSENPDAPAPEADVQQAGAEAFIRSWYRWSPDNPGQPSLFSYGGRAAKIAMEHAVNGSFVVHAPLEGAELVQKLRDLREAHAKDGKDPPNDEDIARELGVPPSSPEGKIIADDVRRLEALTTGMLPLSGATEASGRYRVTNLTGEDQSINDGEELIAHEEAHLLQDEGFAAYISTAGGQARGLRERRAEATRLVLGFDGDPLPTTAIAERLGVSEQTVIHDIQDCLAWTGDWAQRIERVRLIREQGGRAVTDPAESRATIRIPDAPREEGPNAPDPKYRPIEGAPAPDASALQASQQKAGNRVEDDHLTAEQAAQRRERIEKEKELVVRWAHRDPGAMIQLLNRRSWMRESMKDHLRTLRAEGTLPDHIQIAEIAEESVASYYQVAQAWQKHPQAPLGEVVRNAAMGAMEKAIEKAVPMPDVLPVVRDLATENRRRMEAGQPPLTRQAVEARVSLPRWFDTTKPTQLLARDAIRLAAFSNNLRTGITKLTKPGMVLPNFDLYADEQRASGAHVRQLLRSYVDAGRGIDEQLRRAERVRVFAAWLGVGTQARTFEQLAADEGLSVSRIVKKINEARKGTLQLIEGPS